MSKPLGINASFQLVKPSSVEDAIWDAVEKCIDAGVTPSRFKHEAASAWSHVLKEQAKEAERELLKGL